MHMGEDIIQPIEGSTRSGNSIPPVVKNGIEEWLTMKLLAVCL